MERRRFVHRVRFFQFPRPTALPSLAGAVGMLAMTMAWGSVAATALYPHGAGWLDGRMAGLSEPTRYVIATIAFTNGVLGVLGAAAFLRRAWAMLCVRLGLHPVVESEGPCRVIQDSNGRWGLEMILDDGTQEEASGAVAAFWSSITEASTRAGAGAHLDEFESGDVEGGYRRDGHLDDGGGRGTDRWLAPDAKRGPHAVCSYRLLFPLDEAAVARVSRVFDPLETLEIRWLDLPESVGGPTLLTIQAPAREEAVMPLSETQTQLRAA